MRYCKGNSCPCSCSDLTDDEVKRALHKGQHDENYEYSKESDEHWHKLMEEINKKIKK
jgi:hypothetical protein